MFKTSFRPAAGTGDSDDVEGDGDTGGAAGVDPAGVDDDSGVLFALSAGSCVEPQAATGNRQVNRAPAASQVLGM
ncbi:hypothetical protein [Streptomyces sp. NBC_00342]|uniref:hypothetical protein n=1 Tax=Streptomyces sp. NBC_00342 TaxID=2975718 RepID=UPI002E2AFAF0|nr:hypothetical protein [Streptomyces sp. NBC_00342]